MEGGFALDSRSFLRVDNVNPVFEFFVLVFFGVVREVFGWFVEEGPKLDWIRECYGKVRTEADVFVMSVAGSLFTVVGVDLDDDDDDDDDDAWLEVDEDDAVGLFDESALLPVVVKWFPDGWFIPCKIVDESKGPKICIPTIDCNPVIARESGSCCGFGVELGLLMV